MTLDELLLQKLNNWRPSGEGRHTLSFLDAESGASVQLAVERVEALSCELWETRVTRSPAAVAEEPSLEAWAKRVADRVTGLMEPLKVVEVDLVHGQAMLRSEDPAKKNEDRYYYEVLLHRTGTATFRRYRGSFTEKREQVSYILTREALAKLVADLAASK